MTDKCRIISSNIGLGNVAAGGVLYSLDTLDNLKILRDDGAPAQVVVLGNLKATKLSGNIVGEASGLANVNASNISMGTLQNARLPAVITSQFAGDGGGISGLNASNISTGTLQNARLPSSISVTSIAADGSALTNVSASNIATGTLNTARLPSAIFVNSVTANFSGDGYGVSNISANNVSSGTLQNSRLPSTITVANVSANLTGNAAGVFDMNASNISSGILQNSRFPSTITVANVSANLTGNAAGVFDVNASNISSGILNSARLPSTITVANVSANLTGNAAGVFGVNASNISSGTLQNSRLPSTITVANVSANLTGNAAGVFDMNASNISSGILNNARLPSTITVANVSANLTGNAAGVFDMNASNISSGILQNSRLPSSITVANVSANGAGLTSLNASNLTTGTVDNVRLPSSITVANVSANLTGNAAGVFDMNASNISSGTLQNSRLPSSITVANVTANLTGNGFDIYDLDADNIAFGTVNNSLLPQNISVNSVTANLIGAGAGISGVNASNVSSGTLSNSRLPSSITVSNISANGSGLTSLNLANTYGSVLNTQLPSSISVSTVTANHVGDAFGISNVSASNIASGTLQNARLPASITVSNIAANGSGLTSLNLANTYGSVLNTQLPSSISVATITANHVGDAFGISNVSASNIASGTLSNARLPSSITVSNIAANGSGLTSLNLANTYGSVLNTQLPTTITSNLAGDAFGISNVSASNIVSGTLSNARLPASITVSNIAANGSGLTSLNLANTYGSVLNTQLPTTITANLGGDAFGISNVSASNIASGTLSNARLPSSITVSNIAANGSGLTSLNLANTYGSVLNTQLPSSISVGNLTATANVTGSYIFGNGAYLTGVVTSGGGTSNASLLTEGTLQNARLPSSISVSNISANGSALTSLNLANTYGSVLNTQLPPTISVGNVTASGNVSGSYILGNGSLLTGIVTTGFSNASNITSGTLAVAYGGTGVTTKTGTGSVVLNTAPILQGTVVVESVPTSTQSQLHIRAPSGALGRQAVMRMYGTFGGTGADVGTRYISSLRSGFMTYGWSDPYLSVYVDNGTPNDGELDSGQTEVLRMHGNGNVRVTSNLTAQYLFGNGYYLTGITGGGGGGSTTDASLLTSGTLDNARLPSSISVSNIVANGSGLTSLNLANTYGSVLNTQLPSSISVSSVSGNLGGDGFGISNVSASNIVSGTLSNSRLPSSITVSNIAANGSALTSLNLANTYGSVLNTQLPTTITANLGGDAFGISNVSASNISSGTLSNARLPASITVSNIAANGSALTSLNLANTYGSVLNTQLPTTITANLAGDGFGISNVSASTIVSGTLSNARLPSSISVSNIAANGSGLTSLNLANTYGSVLNTQLPPTITANLGGDAFGISNVSASNISSGTLSNARLPSSISVSNIAANGSGLTSLNLANTYGSVLNTQLPSSISVSTVSANLTGDAYGISNVNASNIASGILDNARLPSDISVTSITANGFALTEINAANIVGNIDANVILVGTLDVQNGGTGVTTSSGSGNVILSDTPTFQGLVTVNGNVNAQYVNALTFNSKELQLGTFTQSSVAPFSTHVTSAIAWSPALGIYCAAITSSSNSKLWATSSDGVTWTTTADTFGGSSVYRYMLWVPELAKFAVLAFDYQTAHMGLSSNGTTWTYHAMPYDADYYNGWYWENFTWSPQLGLFAAVASVGYADQRVATSPDGVTWTVRTTPGGGGVWYSNSFTDIVWSGTVFVAVSNNGPVKIMTSPDGVNWTQRTDPVDKPWKCIAYGNGVFIALSDSPAYVLRSLDGITWTAVSLTKTYWNRITYVPELKLFIAVRWPNSGDLVKIMSSRDGVSWTDYVSADIPFSVKYSNPILYFDVAWSSSLNTFLIVGGYYGSTNGWYVSMTPVLGIAAFLNGGSIVARDVSANTVSATQVLGQGFGLSNLNVANITGILLDSSLSGVYSNVQTMRVLGNLRVGNLLIDSGNITTINTAIQISEQIIVTNEGTGPAVSIRQNYTQPIFEAMDDANVTFKIYDGGYVAIGNGSANLGTSPPTSALLSVVGNVSATSYTGNLDASYLTGSIDNARLPLSITVSNISANGAGLSSLNVGNVYGVLAVTNGGTGSTTSTGTGNTVLNVSPTFQGVVTIVGNLNSSNISGNGSGLFGLSASNLSTGTISNALLPSVISVSNISGNGSGLSGLSASNLVTGTISNALLPSVISVSNISGNGSGLFGLSASNLSTGTISNALLPSVISVSNISGNGSGLFGLSASNLSTGTISNALLPLSITVSNISANGAGLSSLNVGNVYGVLAVTNGGTGSTTSTGTGNTVLNVSPTFQGVVTIVGNLNSSNISGNGSGLSGLSASNLVTGTISNALLPSVISVSNISGNGSGLSGLSASNLVTGTISNALLPSVISVSNISGNGSGLSGLSASNLVTGTISNALLPSVISVSNISGNGSGLSGLSASNLSTGTISNALLPSNISVAGNISSGGYLFGNGSFLTGVSTTLSGNGFAISSINAANLVGNIEADLSFAVGSVPGNALYGQLDGDVVFTGDIDANVLVGNVDLNLNFAPATVPGSALYGEIYANIGNVTAPGFTFINNTTTGLYRPAANTLGFTCGGVETAQIKTSGLTVVGNVSSNTGAFNNLILSSRVIPLLDGSSSTTAAPSARYIQQTYNVTTDGAYWINLPQVGPTRVYCIMNPSFGGGGWMMAMKGTRGTTFNYSSIYWTDNNTLNPSDVTRNDADAKYHTYNYFPATDWLAVFPDVGNGGDIPYNSFGHTWVENNVTGSTTTLLEFFQFRSNLAKLSNGVGFAATNPYPKSSPKFKSTIWSSQDGFQFYGMNYTIFSNYSVRWGFAWNNEGNQTSNDVTGGIGMQYNSYSAGDAVITDPTYPGVNRSMRFEWYVR